MMAIDPRGGERRVRVCHMRPIIELCAFVMGLGIGVYLVVLGAAQSDTSAKIVELVFGPLLLFFSLVGLCFAGDTCWRVNIQRPEYSFELDQQQQQQTHDGQRVHATSNIAQVAPV